MVRWILKNKEQSLGFKQVVAESKLTEGIIHTYKEWLLENFEYFTQIDIEESKMVAKRYDAELKHCYYNCWKPITSQKYRYFEGFVWSKSVPLPLEHCWLVKDGKVIDPTLILDVKNKNMKNIENRLGDEYLGVEIPIDFVLKHSFAIKKTGPFIFDFFEKGLKK